MSAASSPSFLLRWRFRAEHGLLLLVTWIVPLIPLRLLRVMASGLGMLGWMADYRGRRAGMENLRAAFRIQELSPAERRRILRKSYRVFARVFCELFWSPRLRPEHWDQYFILDFATPAAEAAFKADHCIYATGHFGNFEWLGLATGLKGGRPMIIAQDFKNPPLTEIFRKLRNCGGRLTIIPQESAMLKLFKYLRRGGSAAALVDLNVKPDQAAVAIRCFGMLNSVSVLHCALAARTAAPLLPALALPEPDGRWRLKFFDPFSVTPEDFPQVIAQRCWDVFEPVIRDYPEYWLWMYKHWRYLPTGEDPAYYPAYANRSKKFDRLVASPGLP